MAGLGYLCHIEGMKGSPAADIRHRQIRSSAHYCQICFGHCISLPDEIQDAVKVCHGPS